MEKYRLYSDLHWGQASSILENIDPHNNDVFLGDIFDIKNTAKKDIPSQLAQQNVFRRRCYLIGAFYIIGNHDLIKDPYNTTQLNIKRGNVLFTHGHLICWDEAKVQEWANKKPDGVGFFRRITLAVQQFVPRGIWKPSDIEIKRAIQLAKSYGCDTIVFGHTHTDKVVDFTIENIRIVNVPRGKTEIEL